MQNGCKWTKCFGKKCFILSHSQSWLTYSSVFTGQLGYNTLIWTLSSRQSYHLIDKLQEWALRIVFKDYDWSFSEFVGMSNESTIHLKVPVTQIYVFKWSLTPNNGQHFSETRKILFSKKKQGL